MTCHIPKEGSSVACTFDGGKGQVVAFNRKPAKHKPNPISSPHQTVGELVESARQRALIPAGRTRWLVQYLTNLVGPPDPVNTVYINQYQRTFRRVARFRMGQAARRGREARKVKDEMGLLKLGPGNYTIVDNYNEVSASPHPGLLTQDLKG